MVLCRLPAENKGFKTTKIARRAPMRALLACSYSSSLKDDLIEIAFVVLRYALNVERGRIAPVRVAIIVMRRPVYLHLKRRSFASSQDGSLEESRADNMPHEKS